MTPPFRPSSYPEQFSCHYILYKPTVVCVEGEMKGGIIEMVPRFSLTVLLSQRWWNHTLMKIFQGLSSFVGLALLPSLALPSLGTHRNLQHSGAQHVDLRTLVMEGDSLLVGLWMLPREEDSIFFWLSSEASYKSSRPSSFSTSSKSLLSKLSSLSEMTPHHIHAPQPLKAPHMGSLSDMTPSWQTQEPRTTAAKGTTHGLPFLIENISTPTSEIFLL